MDRGLDALLARRGTSSRTASSRGIVSVQSPGGTGYRLLDAGHGDHRVLRSGTVSREFAVPHAHSLGRGMYLVAHRPDVEGVQGHRDRLCAVGADPPRV